MTDQGLPADGQPPIPERLSYTSPPALMTGVVLSIVLLSFAMFGWWSIGEKIRSQITWAQGGTLLFFILVMIAIMLSIGYSRIWADERGVTVRNGPIVRRFPVDRIAGVRLRQGDAWSSLLLKNDGQELKRQPMLAIQFLEGEQGRHKVVELRRWLVANGASSSDAGIGVASPDAGMGVASPEAGSGAGRSDAASGAAAPDAENPTPHAQS